MIDVDALGSTIGDTSWGHQYVSSPEAISVGFIKALSVLLARARNLKSMGEVLSAMSSMRNIPPSLKPTTLAANFIDLAAKMGSALYVTGISSVMYSAGINVSPQQEEEIRHIRESYDAVRNKLDSLEARYCAHSYAELDRMLFKYIDDIFRLSADITMLAISTTQMAIVAYKRYTDPNTYKQLYSTLELSLKDLVTFITKTEFLDIKKIALQALVEIVRSNLGTAAMSVLFCNLLYPIKERLEAVSATTISSLNTLLQPISSIINMAKSIVGVTQQLIHLIEYQMSIQAILKMVSGITYSALGSLVSLIPGVQESLLAQIGTETLRQVLLAFNTDTKHIKTIAKNGMMSEMLGYSGTETDISKIAIAQYNDLATIMDGADLENFDITTYILAVNTYNKVEAEKNSCALYLSASQQTSADYEIKSATGLSPSEKQLLGVQE